MADFIVRRAEPDDLDAITAIQAVTFPDFQEDRAVFAERIALYPHGFLVVMQGEAVQGYVVSHPWTRGNPPALNTLFGAMPSDFDAYYIHDMSLMPAIRGKGASAMLVAAVKAHAAACGFSLMMLTAVGGASVFWRRHGFCDVDRPELSERLSGYGPDAVYMEHRLAAAEPGERA